jgi:hypothetical protein
MKKMLDAVMTLFLEGVDAAEVAARAFACSYCLVELSIFSSGRTNLSRSKYYLQRLLGPDLE